MCGQANLTSFVWHTLTKPEAIKPVKDSLLWKMQPCIFLRDGKDMEQSTQCREQT